MANVLPREMWMEVIRHLEPQDHVNTRTVSRDWRTLTYRTKETVKANTDTRAKMTPAVVTFIGQNFSNLKVLDLNGLEYVSTETIKQISPLKHLHTLSLAWCSKIDDSAIELLVKELPKVATLDLSSCYLITETGVAKLAEMKHLADLSLCWANGFPGTAFESFANSITLKTLDLTLCSAVTDAALVLISAIKPLEKLVLKWSGEITDDGVQVLAILPNLKYLDLRWCSKLTEDGVKVFNKLATLKANPGVKTERDLLDLPKRIKYLCSNDPRTQLEATVAFRKVLSIERHPPIDEVLECGALPILISFLSRNENHQLQFEACWAVTNIASGSTEHTMAVINAGALPPLLAMLSSPSSDVCEQAVWCLGNIAGDSPKLRDLLLGMGAMSALVNTFSSTAKLSYLRNLVWAVSNLCRGKPIPSFPLVTPALPMLAQTIYSPDSEVLTDSCWALSYLSDGPDERVQAVIDAGVVRRLVELLLHSQQSVVVPSLRTIGNIVTGNDTQTQIVLNCGAVQALATLLTNPKKAIRKEACWSFSNITAGNKNQIQNVIDANVFPSIVSLINRGEEDVAKEACWALTNATSGGSKEQMAYLVNIGAIPALSHVLTKRDTKTVVVALEGIRNLLASNEDFANLLEECGGLDTIEGLQNHDSEEVYSKATEILETYFDAEADTDPEVQHA